MRKWRVEDSAELYNINGWGVDYFSINDKGNERGPSEIFCIPHCKEIVDNMGCTGKSNHEKDEK
jgi:arginine decarboxylase-like protein